MPEGQQKKVSLLNELGRKVGSDSVEQSVERGRRVPKLQNEVESSDPRKRFIEGHLMTAIGGSGLKRNFD